MSNRSENEGCGCLIIVALLCFICYQCGKNAGTPAPQRPALEPHSHPSSPLGPTAKVR